MEALNLSTFYSLYCELCKNANITPSGVANAIGFNRATVTTWKNTGNTPKGDLLIKVAKYFNVPIDFLLGLPPFNNWDSINSDRKGFIYASKIDLKILKAIWGIDCDSAESIPLISFIKFIDEAIVSAEMTPDGLWIVELNESFKGRTFGGYLKLGKKSPPPKIGDGQSETVRQIMECVNRMSPREQEAFLAWLQASQGRG
ncbi:XRE family transcriptional regulator [Anaerotruncus sp. X29]|nr:XRE family transcriptional regulator [Anaerotruncus sp. X29]